MVEKLKAEYQIDLEWRPFYLYFDTPPEGRELPDYVKRARANGSEERLASIARMNEHKREYEDKSKHHGYEHEYKHKHKKKSFFEEIFH